MLNWFSLKLCCGRAYNGGICARKSSGPAQPRMARLTVVRRLVCPSEIEDEPIKWTFPSIVATIRPLSLLKTISHAKMAPDSHAAKMAPPKAILPSPYEMKRGECNSSPINFIEPELPDCAAAVCRDDERARRGDGADVHATGSADANAGARGGAR